MRTSTLGALRRWKQAEQVAHEAGKDLAAARVARDKALGTPGEAQAQADLLDASGAFDAALEAEERRRAGAQHACEDDEQERQNFLLLWRWRQMRIAEDQRRALEAVEQDLRGSGDLTLTGLLLEAILGPDASAPQVPDEPWPDPGCIGRGRGTYRP